MNKVLVKKRFAKNLENYNTNATVQKHMADFLFDMLDKKEFGSVLEIGCGSGFLTEILYKNLKFEEYSANDIVEECENYINKISSNILFFSGDIEEFILNSSKKYDLIISNASFQWIDTIETFIHRLTEKLNPGGILLFSTFGKDNFKEVFYATGKTLNYKSLKDYELLMNEYNFTIKEETITLDFNSPKDVLKHIKLTGVNCLEETKWTKKDLETFEKKYRDYCKQDIKLTYNPVYIKVSKKQNSTVG